LLIDDQNSLNRQLDLLKYDRYLAVDTEFIRGKSFYPKLSLIQLSGGKTAFAVDAMKDLDLSGIAEILNNRDIIKIFHASRQDIEVIYYKMHVTVKNIFDTQIASLFLGFNEAPSYQKLVNFYLKKNISKNLQYSDWLKRPLDAKQLKYALQDVELLYKIYDLILKDLSNESKLEWALEEFASYEKIEDISGNEEDILKKMLLYIDSREELAHLMNLVRIREEVAKKTDMNRNYIVSNESLIKCVKDRMIPNPISSQLDYDKDIIDKDIIFSSLGELNKKEISLVNKLFKLKNIRNPIKNSTYFSLKKLLSDISIERKISPQLIANSNDLLKLSLGIRKDIKILAGWRKKIFGDKALEMIGKLIL
jgi:ribonuclease D